jgi:ribonuclease HIII
MSKTVEDYVASVEEACGEGRDFIVVFKYNKKNEAIAKILEKAKVEKSVSRIVFDLTFKNVFFRLYGTGKAIFRGLQSKDELKAILTELLL